MNALSAQSSTDGHPAVQLYLVGTADSAVLLRLLQPEVIAHLSRECIGVVLPLRELSAATAALLRRLQQADVPLVGQLVAVNPPSDTFHVRNYPQALERFRQVHAWLNAEQLQLNAIALRVEPPADTPVAIQGLSPRVLARHLWLAHENVLYSAAATAMTELCAEIHLAGMDVHSLQVPLVVDDRWAGTNLLQRAFDLIPVPGDLEVILCPSNLVEPAQQQRLTTAIAALYRDDADGLLLAWPANRAGPALPAPLALQLSLAAAAVDTVYLNGLEQILLGGYLSQITELAKAPHAAAPQVGTARLRLARSMLRAVLVLARYWRPLLTWSGWLAALLLLLRNSYQLRRRAYRG